jgi:hypothetical protein
LYQNDHERGDQWNGEDLSIVSVDDKPLPVSALPKTPDLNQSTSSLLKPPNTASSGQQKKESDDDNSVTPANIKRTLTNPSIMSEPSSRRPELTTNPGYRAAEAYVRPAPITTAGLITNYTFDLSRCQFSMKLQAPKEAEPGAPTVIFLPEYHFPKDACTVEVSSGKWELSSDEDETVLLQKLKWWHGEGDQSVLVTGVVKKLNGDGVPGAEDVGYYEACNQGGWGNCRLM